jgi:hypothetical protein
LAIQPWPWEKCDTVAGRQHFAAQPKGKKITLFERNSEKVLGK